MARSQTRKKDKVKCPVNELTSQRLVLSVFCSWYVAVPEVRVMLSGGGGGGGGSQGAASGVNEACRSRSTVRYRMQIKEGDTGSAAGGSGVLRTGESST
ncbi:hypothetical protein ACRE_016930 [Hapsidospora chrysogenum ATCC 11550]|uniref:Uncharacterized protein n=1 Tax=Hapsidospora chrysogenum (strain ATCC 11550 / CBS 779.69 / DSM 880 / IAM 14645 / JCM 23072 / IMI 49137) TaxID=857340 RepID=A0A086TDR8_HAPC1|nr:hypothetical protein ACRE_016930 [Hapsidospora chrysogenum ATCC 11550]